MRPDLLIAPLNHVLRQSGWAVQLLAPFAGKVAAVTINQALPDFQFVIATDGSLASPSGEQAVAVHIVLPDQLPRRLLLDRQSIFAAATISGSADFAEALGKVFRHLRWDAEADLARVLGDLLAHRAINIANSLLSWKVDFLQRLALNVSEYAVAERGVLLGVSDLAATNATNQSLAAQADALERRLQALER